jgi:hypothetical protein
VLEQVAADQQVEREEETADDQSITQSINALRMAIETITGLRPRIRDLLDLALSRLRGRQVTATEDKRPIVMMLRVLLQFANLRIACPEPGCGAPSLPYFLEQAKGGIIQCQHRTTEGTGKGGHVLFRQGDPWPAVRLLPADGDDGGDDAEEKSEKN